ncbi:MAG: aldehyde dehydrogenase family protein [Deltaproteobacteria bacterium]|nr:aldehyde dehydrogenase family protein [Deltaproteobacteria bacterium]
MTYDFLQRLGLSEVNSGVAHGSFISNPGGGEFASISPVDGRPIAKVLQASTEDYEAVLAKAVEAQRVLRTVPAPLRARMVRDIGDELRASKEDLGKLVSLEMGKILPEGQGEVQEMIDMADLAVGQGRMLYGLTIASERPRHRIMEQWHPLGVVGVITAFNFPVAVWSWNALLAVVCGDAVVWKPSSQTPLTAVAVQKIAHRVALRHGFGEGVFNLITGSGAVVGERMLTDQRIPLVSFTGSTPMGRRVAEKVGSRLGRTILELGGNNAVVVLDDADLDLAVRAVVFGAIGTAGQRCTSTRRVLVQRGVAKTVVDRLIDAYGQVRIGDPLQAGVTMGPLVNRAGVADMQTALQRVREQGGEVLFGGEALSGPGYESGCYVRPCIVRANPRMPIVREETFAPILYVMEVEDLEGALAAHNDVPQGLSSAIFTLNMRSAETFVSPEGSDCGIANVNAGTSGAEIGGAFGGEKETGGGREAGSDAWKQYMRRQTCTINYSRDLPLAQGIRFDE